MANRTENTRSIILSFISLFLAVLILLRTGHVRLPAQSAAYYTAKFSLITKKPGNFALRNFLIRTKYGGILWNMLNDYLLDIAFIRLNIRVFNDLFRNIDIISIALGRCARRR